jgi:preprotein translocase subunit SecD
MGRALAHILLGGFLALSAAYAQDAQRPARRTSLLYQIDTAQIKTVWLQTLQRDARRALSEEKIGHKGVMIDGNRVQVNLREPGKMDTALARLKKLAAPLPVLLFDRLFKGSPSFDVAVTAGENGVIIIEPTAPGLNDRIVTALSRTLEIVRLRADPEGTGETTVEPQGTDRILINVPEAAAAAIKARVGVTAKLTFHLVDASITPEKAQAGGVPPEDLLLPDKSNPGRSVLVYKEAVLSGADLVDAYRSYREQAGGATGAIVVFEFNGKGAATFARVTRESIGKPFAIVLDNEVITAPLIRTEIPNGQGEISGDFDLEEANRLAVLLRSGALPATLSLIEEKSTGP